MRDSSIGRVFWLAVKDPIFRNAARRNLGIAVAEQGFILSNSEMTTLRDFWDTLDPHLPDRRVRELIEGHARLYYAAVVEQKSEDKTARDNGDATMETPEEAPVTRARPARERMRVVNARAAAAPPKMHEHEEFLQFPTNTVTLQQAFAQNRTAWIVRRTEAARETVHCEASAILTASDDSADAAQILLPEHPLPNPGDWIDTLLAWFGKRTVPQQVICWSVTPPHSPEIGATLAERGFVCKWRPSVMCLNLPELITDHECPVGLVVALVNSPLTDEAPDLPFHSPRLARARYAAGRELPRAVWYYAAWLDRKLVGHCTLNVTNGPHGVAGLYDVGVAPAYRHQGIGKALIIVAGLKARELGCRYLLLDVGPESAAERIFIAVGCKRLGTAQMWASSPAQPFQATLRSQPVLA